MPTPQEFLEQVIRPTLATIGLSGAAAENLLLGTAIQESRLVFRRQLGNGPARGLFQMEQPTHDDIWANYLTFRQALGDQVGAQPNGAANRFAELENNDPYACAMARVHYLRVSEALPAANDIAALANYWKRHYNTSQGAGTADEFVANWNKAFGQ